MGKSQPPKRKTRQTPRTPGFSKRCRCELHDATQSPAPSLFKKSSRLYVKDHWQWLISSKLLSSTSNYVCVNCINYAKRNCETQASTSVPSHDDDEGNHEIEPPILDPAVEDILQRVQELTEDQREHLYFNLGDSINKKILDDTKNLAGDYANLDNLANFDIQQFLKGRPKELVNFLSGATNICTENASLSKKTAFAILVEQLYYVRNKNYTGNVSFSQSLVKWALAGSKTITTIDGATTPSGSVTTLKKVLDNSSKQPNKCFSPGDVEVFADNSQRVGKTGRVRESGTTPVNTVTNVVFIQRNQPSDTQTNENLKPSNWSGKMNMTEINKKVTELEESLNASVFRPYRCRQQSEALEKVKQEIKVDNITGEVKDHVQYCVANEGVNVCVNCSKVYGKNYNLCTHCNHNPNNISDRSKLYKFVDVNHPPQPAKVAMGEIIGVNPNSRQTIKHVLKELLRQGNVPNERKWIRIGFDGVPYRIADSLINDIVICGVCGEEVDLQKKSFDFHISSVHPGMTNVAHRQLFDSVLLALGAGHVEINSIRTLFRLCKPIFLDYVSGVLGFKSQRAKDFVSGATNHHVSWQVFRITYDAFARELMYVYVSKCIEEGTTPSLTGMLSWKERVINPNYNLMYDIIFQYFTGVHCHRSGVRCNNSEAIVAGRQTVAPLFYCNNHYIYQKILLSDMTKRVEAPEELKKYITDNESFSRSGDPFRGEGGDFITEGENRTLKSNLSPGIPTLKSWVASSRCSKPLAVNRKAVFQRAGVEDPGSEGSSIFNHELEVQAIRRHIRESGMLHNPYDSLPLRSLENRPLQKDLVNVLSTSQEKYKQYKEDVKKQANTNDEVDVLEEF